MASDIDVRRQAAVIGALVADAAVQPVHWNYKTDSFDAILEGEAEVAFREPSINPFYRIPCGSNTAYGDQALVILRSLVEQKGLDMRHLNRATFDMFGPVGPYENKTNDSYKEKSDAEDKKKYPIDTPWRHFSIKEFLKNYSEDKAETGSPTDEQIDCAVRIVPVTALFAGRPELLDRAEEVIRQTQNNDLCVAIGLAAARILEFCILNGRTDGAVEAALSQLSAPNRKCPQELDAAVAGFLREVVRRRDEPHIPTARSIPGSFQSAVHGLLTGSGYRGAVEGTLRAGGCNASRAGFIGACFAAQEGPGGIPDNWKRKTLKFPEIADLALKLVNIQFS